MFEEYSDEELDEITDRVDNWRLKFSKSEYYNMLTEEQKQESEAVISFFTEYMYTYLGQEPEDWDDRGIKECCLYTLPRKVSAKESFYMSVAPVLSTFFDYLGTQNLLRKTSKLAKRVKKLNKKIVKNGMNPRFWGPTKSIVMSAMDAGVDVTDEKEMNKFIGTYNLFQSGLNEDANNMEIRDMGLATEEDIEEFLGALWDEDKIKKMSTSELIKKFKSLNVTFNEQTFKEQTKDYISAVELAEAQYYTQACRFNDENEDFIWLAIIVLWERLCPEQSNIEMMEDAIKDGFRNIGKNKNKEALKKWSRAWKMLKELVPQNIMSIEEAEEFFSGKMSQLIIPWCENHEGELLHMGMKKDTYFKKRKEFCHDFIDRFPESHEDLIVNMRCAEAESYFVLRDPETAKRIFKELVNKYPRNTQVYYNWGDMYFCPLVPFKVTLDLDRAEEIYKLGIKKGKANTKMLNERLAELEELRDTNLD